MAIPNINGNYTPLGNITPPIAVIAATAVAIAYFSSPPIATGINLAAKIVPINLLLTSPFTDFQRARAEPDSWFWGPCREEIVYRWTILDLIDFCAQSCGVAVEVAARIALVASSALFAIDHIDRGRPLMQNAISMLSSGAMAYFLYGPLFVQCGLVAAISAHVFNNIATDLLIVTVQTVTAPA